jgi:hypothetical protein
VGEQQVQARITIERAREDEPRRADRGLGGPAHDEGEHEVAPVLVGGQVTRGMHEQRTAQPLGGGEQRRARGVVEVAAPVGGIDEGAGEAQLADHALQLPRCALSVPGIHAAEADQTPPMPCDQRGEAVVVQPGAVAARPSGQLLRRGLHEKRIGHEGMGDAGRVLRL